MPGPKVCAMHHEEEALIAELKRHGIFAKRGGTLNRIAPAET